MSKAKDDEYWDATGTITVGQAREIQAQSARWLQEAEEAQKNPVHPTERNAGLDPKPAIPTIACLFVTCPSCSSDIEIATPDGDTTNWTFDDLDPFTGPKPEELRCQECGQPVTVSLPKALPVNP